MEGLQCFRVVKVRPIKVKASRARVTSDGTAGARAGARTAGTAARAARAARARGRRCRRRWTSPAACRRCRR